MAAMMAPSQPKKASGPGGNSTPVRSLPKEDLNAALLRTVLAPRPERNLRAGGAACGRRPGRGDQGDEGAAAPDHVRDHRRGTAGAAPLVEPALCHVHAR